MDTALALLSNETNHRKERTGTPSFEHYSIRLVSSLLSNISNSSEILINCSSTFFTSDSTTEEESPTEMPIAFQMPSWGYTLMTAIYACIFLVGVAGNILVILVIAKDRRMRNTANFYLISLSVADLMIIVFCLPVAAYELQTDEAWYLGPVLCRFAPFLQYLSTNASIGTMVAISIERFIVVCRPFKVRVYCTRKRAFAVIITVWAFSVVCAMPLVKFTVYESAEHYVLQQNVSVCYIDHGDGNEIYFFSHQAFFYVLPGLLLCILYLIIILNLRQFKREQFGHSPDSRRNLKAGAKTQADTSQQLIMMLSIVVLCYFLCLLPYNTITFVSLVASDLLTDLFNTSPTTYSLILNSSRIMFFFNSCSNPILYNAISQKFRNAFLRLFCPARYKRRASGGAGGIESRSMSMRSLDCDYDHQVGGGASTSRFDAANRSTSLWTGTSTSASTSYGGGENRSKRWSSDDVHHHRTRNGQQRGDASMVTPTLCQLRQTRRSADATAYHRRTSTYYNNNYGRGGGERRLTTEPMAFDNHLSSSRGAGGIKEYRELEEKSSCVVEPTLDVKLPLL